MLDRAKTLIILANVFMTMYKLEKCAVTGRTITCRNYN